MVVYLFLRWTYFGLCTFDIQLLYNQAYHDFFTNRKFVRCMVFSEQTTLTFSWNIGWTVKFKINARVLWFNVPVFTACNISMAYKTICSADKRHGNHHRENVPSAKLPQMRMSSRGNVSDFSLTPIWPGYPLLGCYQYHQPIVLGSLWWRLWSFAIN